MKKLQNGNSRKFVPSPSIASPVNVGEAEKTEPDARRNDKEGLKIFFDSSHLNSEPQFEWNFKNERKKPLRQSTRKAYLEEKKKKQAEKNKQSITHNSLDILQNHIAKLKSEAPGKLHPKRKIPTADKTWFNDDIRQNNEPENLKAPVNSLFTLRKENLDPWKKAETVKTMQDPLVQRTGSLDVNNQYLDGKKKINEILKMHAQKFQACSTKSNQHIKDSFHGVTELLKKVQNISSANKEKTNETDTTETIKENKSESQEEEVETKSKEQTGGKEQIKSKEQVKAKEIPPADKTIEEKKNPIQSLLKVPQSNELGRRLQTTGPKSGFLFPNDKDGNVGETEEEKTLKKENTEAEKNSKKENGSEEEKNSSKKQTYTDRLILLRMTGKDDEKKSESSTENDPESKKEFKVTTQERLETINRILSSQPKPKSQLLISVKDAAKEIDTIRDPEQLFKTKASRSTELRDLVTQAVKEHKIFCIFDNHSYIVRPVREELLSRGWLEVIPDRRLIPRRRPPPMGPTTDRDKLSFDRNCNTLEAILAARETFVDEIQESVSKSTSFRTVLEVLKPTQSPGFLVCKKTSQESLSDTPSLFRIIPPTPEKKKNNAEIRGFVSKYEALLDKDSKKFRDKKPKEKEKYYKNAKMSKTPQTTPIEKNEDREEASENLSAAGTDDEMTDTEKKNLQLGVLYDFSSEGKQAGKTGQNETKKQDAGEKSYKILYTEAETKTISKMIQSMNARIQFMWLSIKPGIHLKCFNYSPEIINKFQKTTFCTKIGLWNHLNNIQWYSHEVHYPAKSPRMYNTGEADDLQAFFQDFQLTACIGMLKWLSETFFDRGMKAVQTKKGKVPLKAFEFAIKQCEKYIKFKDNEDLSLPDERRILQDEWNNFLQWFYIITNDHGKVQESSSAQLMVVYTKAVETLKLMKRYWPEIDIEGRLNIWIMKPYCASCGRGIFMTNNVYYIGQHSKYIVQKYIEKPLLIYNTKFDIRQWFMITKLTPLEIWMYKECYLRFCTQPFALRNLHESVHLSNNSVQRKYITPHDSTLPDQNMWDSKTFQLYLRTIGFPNAWDDIIYPGMKDAIISTMLAAQDTFDGPRKSWFEVYGADFMISAKVKDGPWLIEINENPAMDPSTKVTARLCPQMLRDVIKVVVDKRYNKNASTGEWELVYRQNYSPSFGSVDIDVRGKKIARVPYNPKPITNPKPTPGPLISNPQDGKSLPDYDTQKLYEIVKSIGAFSNSRGDTKNVVVNSCAKMIRSLKFMEKGSSLLEKDSSYMSCNSRQDRKSNLPSLMSMTENRPNVKDKKEEHLAHKIITKTVEMAKTTCDDGNKSIRESNKSVTQVASIGRCKSVRYSDTLDEALEMETLLRVSRFLEE